MFPSRRTCSRGSKVSTFRSNYRLKDAGFNVTHIDDVHSDHILDQKYFPKIKNMVRYAYKRDDELNG